MSLTTCACARRGQLAPRARLGRYSMCSVGGRADASDQPAVSVAMKALSQAADLRLPLRLAFSVVLARAKLSAILRSKARFLTALRSRTRLASSLNPTSSTQWSPFSIAQWLRMAEASCVGGSLLLER